MLKNRYITKGVQSEIPIVLQPSDLGRTISHISICRKCQ